MLYNFFVSHKLPPLQVYCRMLLCAAGKNNILQKYLAKANEELWMDLVKLWPLLTHYNIGFLTQKQVNLTIKR